MRSFPYRSSYITRPLAHRHFPSLAVVSHKMASLASSSKLTLSNSLSPPSIYPSHSASHWSLDSIIPKPKPVMRATKSQRVRGFHPPYAIGEYAYIRHSSPHLSSPHYDLYLFEGSHRYVADQHEQRYTAVFRRAGQCGYNAVAFEMEEDCQIDRPTRRIPPFVIWLRTICCPCFWWGEGGEAGWWAFCMWAIFVDGWAEEDSHWIVCSWNACRAISSLPRHSPVSLPPRSPIALTLHSSALQPIPLYQASLVAANPDSHPEAFAAGYFTISNHLSPISYFSHDYKSLFPWWLTFVLECSLFVIILHIPPFLLAAYSFAL